jgi:gas vesicle protein
MTNLRDYLNDFSEEIKNIFVESILLTRKYNSEESKQKFRDSINNSWKKVREEKIEEYLQIIKDRLIG